MKTENKRYALNLIFILVTAMMIFCTISFAGSRNIVKALDYEKPLDLFLEEYYGTKTYKEFKEDKKDSTYVTMIERAFNVKDEKVYSLEFIFYKDKKSSWANNPTVDINIGNGYKVYNLVEEESLYGKFKRFSVKDDNKEIYKAVLSAYKEQGIRTYEVSNINAIKGNTFKVEGKYEYTGFMQGCSEESKKESTLKAKQTQIDVLDLKLNHYSYDNPAQSIGDGYHWKVYSVAYGIPNEYLADNYKLTEVHARYYEALLHAIFVSQDQGKVDYLNNYSNMLSTHIPKSDSYTFSFRNGFNRTIRLGLEGLGSIAGTIAAGIEIIKRGGDVVNYERFVWNPTKLKVFKDHYNADLEMSYQIGAIKHDSAMSPTTKEEIRKFLERKLGKSLDEWNEHDRIFEDGMGGYRDRYIDEMGYNTRGWQEIEIKNTDRASAKTFKEIQKDSNFPLAYSNKLRKRIKDQGIPEHDKLLELNDSNINGSARDLLVNSNELSELRQQYEKNKSEGKTTFLMRFAVRNAFNTSVRMFKDGIRQRTPKGGGDDTYVFQQKAFMDFRIISLTFRNEKDVKIVPVGHDPLQIIPGAPVPLDPKVPHIKTPKSWAKFKDIMKKIGIALGVIVGVAFVSSLIISIVRLVQLAPAGKAYVKGTYGIDIDAMKEEKRKQKDLKRQQALERREKRKEMRENRKIKGGSE